MDELHGTPARPLGLLRDDDAAEYLDIKPQTLRQWRTESRKRGRLVGPRWVDIGIGSLKGRPRYRLSDLEAYVASKAVALEPLKRRGRPRLPAPQKM